jgi:PTS system beta-glucosides-specific IIC component
MTDEALAQAIITQLGVHNIVRLTHCATRLRIQLRASAVRQQVALNEIPEILGLVSEDNHLQIVVGGRAATLHHALQKQLSNAPPDVFLHSAHLLERIGLYIANTFQPLFPLLAPAGLLLGLFLWLQSLNLPFLSPSSVSLILGISELPFTLLPAFLTLSAARVLGLRPFVSGAMVAPLLHPAFVASANELFAIPWQLAMPASYLTTITPWLIMVAVARPLEKFLDRNIETSLAIVLTPLLLLTIMIPLTFTVIGPVGWHIDQKLVKLLDLSLDALPILMGALLGASWLHLIRMGQHWLLIPLMYLQYLHSGFTTLAPIIWGSTYAQIGVSMAMIWHNRRQESWYSTHALLRLALLTGITEPILYRFITPSPIAYRNAQIVGGIGGAVSAYFHFKAPPSIIAGLFSLPGVTINKSPLLVLFFIASTLIIATLSTSLILKLAPKFNK